MSVVTIHHGDSREVLKGLADASIDSVVTDPPYALVSIGKRFGADGAAPAKAGKTGAYQRASAGFMGQRWDTGETAFDPEFWAEVLRVLKPGGHLIAASGTRTYHRLACAVEDAGFEIRDMVSWLYGSGFPKSHDVSKGIDKAAGAERRVIAEGKPVKRMIPGADQARDGWEKTNGRTFTPAATEAATEAAKRFTGWGTALKPACEPWVMARKPLAGTVAGNSLKHGVGGLNIDACRVGLDGGTSKSTSKSTTVSVGGYLNAKAGEPIDAGRWPANVVHDGSAEVLDAFPATTSGIMKAGTRRAAQDAPGSVVYGVYGGDATKGDTPGDSGSAARFFYSAKADAEDRLGSKHPTVKPVDLMAWLCRLVTPPGGVVLDPFAGSGSTGVACLGEGFDCILIEREAAYVADIERRIAWAKGEGRLTTQEMARDVCPAAAGGFDLPLFADAGASQPASQPDADAGYTESSRTKAHRADGIEMVNP